MILVDGKERRGDWYRGGPKAGVLWAYGGWLDGLKVTVKRGPRARHQFQEKKAQRALRREARRSARRARRTR